MTKRGNHHLYAKKSKIEKVTLPEWLTGSPASKL